MRLRYKAAALGFALGVGFILGARATSIAARSKLDEIEAAMLEIRRAPSDEGTKPATAAAQWFEDHPITQRVKAQEREAAKRARARGDSGAVARARAGLRSDGPAMRDEWA